MQWDSVSDFAAMGGYGAFVWPSVAVAVIVIAWLIYSSLAERAVARTDLAALEAEGQGRRGRAGTGQS